MRLSSQALRAHREQADLFRALGHPARIAILSVLRDGEQCVCHLEAMLGLRQSTISQHLMVMRSAGLVEDRRDGWNIYYRCTRSSRAMLSGAQKLTTSSKAATLPQGHAAGACPCPKCSRKPIKSPSLAHAGRTSDHA